MKEQTHIPKQILTYDKERFPFHELISQFINTKDLDELSSEKDTHKKENSFYKNMEQTPVFKQLYANLEGPEGESFYQMYEKFITEVIRPLYDESIYYQSKPSHRILFKDIAGEARFHRDSDYGHSSDEVNYWLPQTPAFKSNSIWIESKPNTEDYEPVNLEVGQVLQFHGADLSHGAFPNTTGKTRVSFDFRVIPFSKMSKEKGETSSADDANPVMSNARKFSFCE